MKHAAIEPSVPAPTTIGISTDPGVRIKASPAARKKARVLGVDLRLISGTGPGGRILEGNVQAYFDKQGAGQAAPTSTAAQKNAGAHAVSAGGRELPLSSMRRTIARR